MLAEAKPYDQPSEQHEDYFNGDSQHLLRREHSSPWPLDSARRVLGLKSLLLQPLDAHLAQSHRRARTIVGVARQLGDFVRHVLPFHHLAENGVLVVQPRRRRYGDEKLAAVRPWTGVSHGKLSGLGVLQRSVKLVGESVTRSAASVPPRASSLDHEVGNHAVKRQAVIIVFLLFLARHFVGKFLGPFRHAYEIRHRLGPLLFQQPNDNVSLRSLEYCVRSSRSSHAFSSRTIVHERPQTAPLPILSEPACVARQL